MKQILAVLVCLLLPVPVSATTDALPAGGSAIVEAPEVRAPNATDDNYTPTDAGDAGVSLRERLGGIDDALGIFMTLAHFWANDTTMVGEDGQCLATTHLANSQPAACQNADGVDFTLPLSVPSGSSIRIICNWRGDNLGSGDEIDFVPFIYEDGEDAASANVITGALIDVDAADGASNYEYKAGPWASITETSGSVGIEVDAITDGAADDVSWQGQCSVQFRQS